jgi:hypothetical protein
VKLKLCLFLLLATPTRHCYFFLDSTSHHRIYIVLVMTLSKAYRVLRLPGSFIWHSSGPKIFSTSSILRFSNPSFAATQSQHFSTTTLQRLHTTPSNLQEKSSGQLEEDLEEEKKAKPRSLLENAKIFGPWIVGFWLAGYLGTTSAVYMSSYHLDIPQMFHDTVHLLSLEKFVNTADITHEDSRMMMALKVADKTDILRYPLIFWFGISAANLYQAKHQSLPSDQLTEETKPNA